MWQKTPIEEYGEVDKVNMNIKIKTPQGRKTNSKRAASPLEGTEKKTRTESSSSSEDEEEN